MKFSKQLQKIMQHFHLTTTELADQISVPKATISHLISERNKPSLEFIMKLHTTFPTLNLEWLIYEKGPFLTTDQTSKPIEINQQAPPTSFELPNDLEQDLSGIDINNSDGDSEMNAQNITKISSQSQENILSFKTKSIDCIVIFYKDGSFKKYNE